MAEPEQFAREASFAAPHINRELTGRRKKVEEVRLVEQFVVGVRTSQVNPGVGLSFPVLSRFAYRQSSPLLQPTPRPRHNCRYAS